MKQSSIWFKRWLLGLASLFIGIGMLFAQEVTISGTVTSSEDGLPIPGVSVVQKGTSNGTITDFDGKYQLKVPRGSVVVFSFIGMKTQELAMGSAGVFNVKLLSETTGLDEVVVTALGVKRERKALGYSMSSLKADELQKAGTPINPLTSLYGKAAGVRVSATAGGPSAGMVLNIRNAVSLNESSSTRPLIVVDGIPIHDENTSLTRNDRLGRDRGTGINDINASDIESMDILKGAKAAVLYGSAGANGVILITTKSGAKKKGFGIEASLSNTWENIALLPELQDEFGTGGNVAYSNRDPQLVDENGFLYTMVNGVKTKTFFNEGSASFGPKMDGSNILWWNGQMLPYSPQPDNYKELFQQGNMQTANLVMANGGEIGNYRISYTAKNYKGIQLNSRQQNHNLSLNANVNVSDRVKVSTTSNYYYTFSSNPAYNIQDIVTYGVSRDLKTNLLFDNVTDDGGYWFYRDKATMRKMGVSNQVIGLEYVWDQLQNKNNEEKHHIIESVSLDMKLADWLSFKGTGGFDMTRSVLEVKKKVTEPLAINPFQGYYGVYGRDIFKFYTQYTLNVDKSLTENLHLSGFVGGVYTYNSNRSVGTTTQDFIVENWFSTKNSSREVKSQGEGSRGSDVLYSALGSFQLAYKDFLFFELQGRNDWSSILPPSENSYFYPGASLSWIASQSLSLPDYIKYAKARVSLADVGRPGPRYFGNMGFDIYSYGSIPYATTNGDIPPLDFEGANGKLPVENLKPERKRELELGVEMNFFHNNRIGFDFSWYRSNTYDQIIALSIPASSGASKIRVNAGDIQQSGFELQLRGKPVASHNFQWESVLNIAKDKNKIKDLAYGIDIIPLWGVTGAKIEARIGEEYGAIYVNPYRRNEKGERIVSDAGVYEFDKENPKKVGKITPDFTGGFINNFSYKGLTLGVDIDFQFGGTLISQTNMYLKGNGTGKESLKYRDEARGGLPYYVNSKGEFVKVGSHTSPVPADAKYNFLFHDGVILPGVKSDGVTPNDKLICAEEYYSRTYWNGDMSVSEDAIYKSDYVSLRRITLSYAIPDQWTKKMGIYNAQISLFGSNLAYLYKDLPNVSPESTLGTNSFTESNAASMVRTLGVELKLGF